ncbi:MAG: hypothetical protein Q8L20_10860 [Gammaproteobacteria bacterium]|nr:hypothetical protein [Gammaproteobacteria bacterium]
MTAKPQSSASKEAKAAGLESLAEVSAITGKHPNTLTRWHKDEHDLFRAVIFGCAQIKTEAEEHRRRSVAMCPK